MGQSMMNLLSPAVRDMKPSGIRKFFDLVDGKDDVISLGVGEPDFVTPKAVRDACIHALEQGRTSYTSNAGLPELREAIAEYLLDRFQVSYDMCHEVLVTVGSSEAIDLALRALITTGDEILIPTPSYLSYSPITALCLGVPVPVETSVEDGFKLTATALEDKISARSKVLILSYPNNPTGATMTYQDWLPIAKLVEEHNLVVISDEIYAEMTYGGQHVSFASLPGMKDRTILISGFSKAFAMTGWRVGYACGHRDLIGAMLKIHQYTAMCAPIIGQIAALESLRIGLPEKDAMMHAYNERRRFIVQALRHIGLPCYEPLGSFFAFPSVSHLGMTSEQFAARLLADAKVVAVPGDAFGSAGEGFIRCSYAVSLTKLEMAMDRMDVFLRKLQQVYV